MKKDSHPEYKEVVFLDMSTGKKFLCRSVIETSETVEFEGKTYPSKKVSISSDSHPFYTGSQTLVDTEGRIDKFKKRYTQKPASPKPAEAAEEPNAEKKTAVKKAPAKKSPAKKEATKKAASKK